MRGERHHHGGHICGIVVLGFTVLLCTIPTVESYGAGIFFPARTLIAVKLVVLFVYLAQYQYYRTYLLCLEGLSLL